MASRYRKWPRRNKDWKVDTGGRKHGKEVRKLKDGYREWQVGTRGGK